MYAEKQTMAAAGTCACVLTVVLTTVLPPRACWRGPATQQYIRTHMAMGITTQKRMKKKTERPIARPAAGCVCVCVWEGERGKPSIPRLRLQTPFIKGYTTPTDGLVDIHYSYACECMAESAHHTPWHAY